MPFHRVNKHLSEQVFDDSFLNLLERLIVSISRVLIREHLRHRRQSKRVGFLNNRRNYISEEEEEDKELCEGDEESNTESEENEEENSNRAPDIIRAKSIRGLDEVDDNGSFIQSCSIQEL